MQARTKLLLVMIVSAVIGAGCASDKAEQRQEYGSSMQTAPSAGSTVEVPYAESTPTPPAAMPSTAATEGLCSLRLEQRANAEIDAEVDKQSQSVIVELTTEDQAAVQTLRGQAMELANTRSYRLGGEGQAEALDETETQSAAPLEVPVNVTAQNIEDGARLTFVPTNVSDVEPLQAQLERDAEQMEKGDCAVPAGSAAAAAVP
jgi:hypothetical protein